MGRRKDRKRDKEQRTTNQGAPMNTPVVATPKAVALPVQGGFFSAPSSEDIIIPKILCLHYMSKKVKDKSIEAAAGDFRDTLSNEKFGDTEHPFEFIPIGIQKHWTIHKKEGNEFIEKFAWTPANAGLAREENGLVRFLTFEVYVIIPKKLEEGSGLPYVLSFRSTTQRVGKVLATKQFEFAQRGLNLWDFAFELSAKESSNDKGDFFAQNTVPKRKTTPAEKEEAKKWFDIMNAGTVSIKVDDSDLKDAHPDQADTEQF